MNAALAAFCKLLTPSTGSSPSPFVPDERQLAIERKPRHLQPIEYRVAQPAKLYELWFIRKSALQKAVQQQIPRVGDG